MNERRKTRNQWKRELRKLICVAAAVGMLMASVMCMMVKAWAEHPAEQPVNGYEYIASIGGDPDVLS